MTTIAWGRRSDDRLRRYVRADRLAAGDGALIDPNATPVYGEIMDYRHLITIEPDKRSGQPCIRGLRMTVQDVLEYLASGMSIEEILADFPDLTAEDIRACLAFAADRERRLRVVPPT
jgi:uncharacterized protein (DUF433 family)